MQTPLWLWIDFNACILIVLAIDLFGFQRKAHVPSERKLPLGLWLDPAFARIECAHLALGRTREGVAVGDRLSETTFALGYTAKEAGSVATLDSNGSPFYLRVGMNLHPALGELSAGVAAKFFTKFGKNELTGVD